MLPTTKYFDKGDRILEVVTLSATERTTRWLPKPYVGESAKTVILPPKGNEVRRIENKRNAQPVEKGPGLGDRAEAALTSVGVTKERWTAFKQAFGLGPTCNCDARKEWLNKVGEQLGEAAHEAVAKLWGGKVTAPETPAAPTDPGRTGR